MAGKNTEDTAEKAYAEAAAKLKPAVPAKAPAKAKTRKVVAAKTTVQPVPVKKPAPIQKPAPAVTPIAAKKAAPKPPVAAKSAPAPAPKTVPAPPAPEPVAAIAVPDPMPSATPVAPEPEAITELVPPTVKALKETIMATATPNFTDTATDAMNELQSRAQVAYEKSTEALGEMSEFAKGNVKAIVESSKIVASGVQSLGKSYVEEAKSAYETLTADLKEMAAIKSPTDLFQLQGKIMRRNFDALVAAGSKNTEAAIKLANDAFAPLSGRVNLATEKLAKVA